MTSLINGCLTGYEVISVAATGMGDVSRGEYNPDKNWIGSSLGWGAFLILIPNYVEIEEQR